MSLIRPRLSQIIDDSGNPVVNGYVYFGTYGAAPRSNLITIYANEAQSSSLANPQRTDSLGRIANDVYLSVDYSYEVSNSSDVTIEGAKNRRLSSRAAFDTADAISIITLTETSSNLYDIDEGWLSLPPAGVYRFVFPTTNTGAVTITFDGIAGTFALEDSDSVALAGSEITASKPMAIYWTGTEFLIQGGGAAGLDIYSIRLLVGK
tara:strand:- start:108 stop:728 length:621 start_codon:yes stop_codon:yes gene_type:complete